MARTYLEGTWQNDRSFSPAVITAGGRTVWCAGHGAARDDDGNSLAGDFEAQTHQSFKLLSATLEKAGATLQDMVTMTVFILDARHGTRFTEIRYTQRRDGPYAEGRQGLGYEGSDAGHEPGEVPGPDRPCRITTGA